MSPDTGGTFPAGALCNSTFFFSPLGAIKIVVSFDLVVTVDVRSSEMQTTEVSRHVRKATDW